MKRIVSLLAALLLTSSAYAQSIGPGGGSATGGTPGGSSNSVQYNNAGAFGGIPLGANQFLLGQSGAAPVAGSFGSSIACSGSTCNTTTADTTHTASATISNVGGQDNFNGSGLTATVPGTGTLGNGQSALITNQNASALTLSNTQTLNGLPLATTLHQYGFYGCTGNGTSCDAFGFPGFGTITTNALQKFIDDTGAATASALSDNGTIISASENFDVISFGLATEVANAGTTGTTVNHLAKLAGAPSTAVITATTDTDNAVGIVIGGAGTTGNAQIAVSGQAACVFDGATTAGDYVSISGTTAGDCHDAGASRPLGSQAIGRVLSTNAAGGTYAVALALGTTNTGGGGSGTVNSGTAGQIAAYSATGTAVSGETVSGDCTHAAGGAFTCPIKPVPTGSGSSAQTLTGNSNLYVCTAACTITLPTPAAGIEACVRNAPGVSTAITLAALGGSGQYEKTDSSGYGTAGTGTLASSGAVGDKVCVHALDSTHYLIGSYNGTWTAS